MGPTFVTGGRMVLLLSFIWTLFLKESLTAFAITCTSVPTSETNALYSLYNSTNGKSWTWKANKGNHWVFNTSTPNPCANHWQGITCKQETTSTVCHIDTLVLSSYNLQGTLPRQLDQLNYLTILQLSSNRKLIGTVPLSIGNMTTLTKLLLFTNALTGTFPSTVTKLPHVLTINLNGNHLRGTLPNTFENNIALTQIDLGYNQFTGTIPTCFMNMPNIITFYLHDNLFSGSIPEDIGGMTNLLRLDLGNNQLTGSIPRSIAMLSQLYYFFLDYNQLTGSIPEEIGYFNTGLMYFVVATNHISGSIPDSFVNLYNLIYFLVNDNRLHGTLPHDLGNMTSVVQFAAFYNYLTGSIPQSVCELSQLSVLHLARNQLTGTIPENIGEILGMQQLYLDTNHLTGSIPDSVANMSYLLATYLTGNILDGSLPHRLGDLYNLIEFEASNNFLSGTIPDSICELYQLSTLQLFNNELSGTIPKDFGNMTSLYDVQLWLNYLTGTIPQSFRNLYQLSQLLLNGNKLSGPFPEVLLELPSLSELLISTNRFTGTIPAAIANMEQLTQLYLFANHFTGTIPAELGAMPNLVQLGLDSNYLTGSVPSSFNDVGFLLLNLNQNQLTGTVPTIPFAQDLSVANNFFHGTLEWLKDELDLSYLGAGNNFFTGSVPAAISQFPNIAEIQIDNNLLTGPISQIFNESIQVQLFSVQLSNNDFTGSLPVSLFALPKLVYLAAAMNCLTGSIPNSICDQKDKLEVLIFDGLRSAESCQEKLFPGIPQIHTLAQRRAITGTIPACLFGEMEKLELLHLSGNGITGTLPDNYNSLPEALRKLSLSHNSLRGTIPLSFQNHLWKELDLSFNLLSGDISQDINIVGYQLEQNGTDVDKTGLVLNNNRLSGNIPSSILDLSTIDILAGNMFDCGADHKLPVNDAAHDTYTCGSEEANNALITYLVLLVFVCLVVALVLRHQWVNNENKATSPTSIQLVKYMLARLKQLFYIALDPHDPNYPPSAAVMYNYLNNTYHLHVYTFRITALTLAFYLIWYGGLGAAYSTFTHKYLWSVSIAYLSGMAPGATLFVLLLITLIWFFLDVRILENCISKDNKKAWRYINKISNLFFIGKGMQNTTINLINPNQHLGEHHEGEVVELSLITKILFGVFVSVNVVLVVVVNGAYISAIVSGATFQQQSLLAFAMSIFKTITATIIMQSLDWKFMAQIEQVWGEDTVTRILLALSLFNNIVAPCITTAFVNTNCFYYALIPADNIVTSAVGTGYCRLALNDGQTCVKLAAVSVSTDYQPPFTYSYDCSSSLLTIFTPVWMYMFVSNALAVPLVMCLLISIVEVVDQFKKVTPGKLMDKLLDKVPFRLRSFPRIIKQLKLDPANISKLSAQVIDSRVYTIMITTNFAIMLCFGVLFPPLAVAGGIATIIQTMLQKVFVIRIMDFVNNTDDDPDVAAQLQDNETKSILRQLVLRMDYQCNKIPQTYFRTAKIIAIYVSIVWGAFLLDIVGDEVGIVKSIWVFIIMVLTGFTIRILGILVGRRQKQKLQEASKVENQVDIELTSFKDNHNHDEELVIENPMLDAALQKTPEKTSSKHEDEESKMVEAEVVTKQESEEIKDKQEDANNIQ